jgi:hypothetical protein
VDRKYLAFDLEIAKVIPDGEGDPKPHRPLGISCAATLVVEDGEVRNFLYSRASGASPAPQVNQFDLQALVGYLS